MLQRIRADNPGPMTLEGTNTYLLAAPGATRAVVVDPGPALPAHLSALHGAAQAGGVRIAGIVLTHGHGDHSEAAPALAAATGAWVRAVDPAHRLGEEGLGDGAVVDVDGLELRVVATPGHSADSVSLHLPAERAVLTGDTVLGRGTTVVAHPDGRLADYLDSLQRLADLAGDLDVLWPGHGPALDAPVTVLRYYTEHRAERLEQVRQALRAGADSVRGVVDAVYTDVPAAVLGAAALSVAAQLEYLAERERTPLASAAGRALRSSGP